MSIESGHKIFDADVIERAQKLALEFEGLPFVKAMFPRTQEVSPTSEEMHRLINALAGEATCVFLDTTNRSVQRALAQRTSGQVIEHQYSLAFKAVDPTRFGDKYANELEALETAYQYLKDDDLRKEYALTMTCALCIDKDNMPQAHEKLINANVAETRQTILNRQPRRLGVQAIDDENKSVELTWQPIQPTRVFQLFCHAIVIIISDERRIRIERNELEKLYNASSGVYVKTIQFSNLGIYSLRWFAEMNDHNTLRETQHSHPIDVRIAHPKEGYVLEQAIPLLETARRKTGELKRELTNLITHPVALHDRAESQRRQRLLQEGMNGAMSTIDELTHILRDLDLTDSQETEALVALKEVRAEAVVQEQQLSAALESLDKKANFKSFVRNSSGKLETGEAVAWIKQVSKEDIVRQGADPNRLYQLLVDNKKSKALIQPSLLQAAAARSDLFQPKQCEALLKRSRASQVQKRGQGTTVPGANPSDSGKSKAPTPSGSSSSKTASTTKSELSVSPLTISSSEGDSTKSFEPVKFSQSLDATVSLLQFLETNKSCLKCSPQEFFDWLTSQDVHTLDIFWEAFGDNNFVVEMQQNGVKGFKRSTLKENLFASLNVHRVVPSAVGTNGK